MTALTLRARVKPGLIGPPVNLSIGSVATGDAGTDAAVAISGDPPDQALAFTIPRGATGATGASYTATSTSSQSIGSSGTKTFTTQSGLAYAAGARVRAADAAAPDTNWMEGVVTSYSGTTLAFTADKSAGSGTLTDWKISIAGEPGSTGATGATGPAGSATSNTTFLLTGIISPSQITADQNDYAPTGHAAAAVFRLSSDASRNITGLAGGSDGRIVIVHNVGAQNIVLKDESASSTAANRFALTADVTLAADAVAILQYDGTSSRWRAVSGSGSGSAVLYTAQSLTEGQKNQAQINIGVAPSAPHGRLTLTSGTPITTSDVTGATTLYYTPATGRHVPLWNGSSFTMTDTGGELTNDTTASSTGKAGPAAVAADKVYYLMVWNDAGTIRLTRSPAWASDTDPGTGAGTAEIEAVQGIWVNKYAVTNGPAAGYGTIVGAVRSDGSSQLKDTTLFRWVSNIYNQAPRKMRVVEATNSWAASAGVWRYANNNAANRADVLFALAGQAVQLNATVSGTTSAITPYIVCGIGLDWSSGDPSDCLTLAPSLCVTSAAFAAPCFYCGYPGRGRHYFAWLEHASSADITFLGDGGGALIQNGLTGVVLN